MTEHEDDQPAGPPVHHEPTVLEVKPAHRAILVIGLAALGLALGVAAPYVLQWADGRDWLPFEGPRKLLAKVVATAGGWVLIIVGGVVGLFAGLGLAGDLTRVTVSESELLIVKGSKKDRFSRRQVSAALYDGKELIVRDDRDADLIRKELDVPKDDVLAALRRHDWPIRS